MRGVVDRIVFVLLIWLPLAFDVWQVLVEELHGTCFHEVFCSWLLTSRVKTFLAGRGLFCEFGVPRCRGLRGHCWGLAMPFSELSGLHQKRVDLRMAGLRQTRKMNKLEYLMVRHV